MLQIVQKLSIADHEARKTALIQQLETIGVDYETQRSMVDGLLVENFIVKFGDAQKRIVIGAHYDSVDGSTGANDNASGVSILLEVIKQFHSKPPAASLEFVFFDYEEVHALGSKLYVEEYGSDVLAMINLDICGVGDHVLIAPQKNLQSGILAQAVQKVDQSVAPFGILDKLPPGDDCTFEEHGIPNISVCILEERDVQPMSVLFSGQTDVPKTAFPSIIETMHNGSRDTVEIITQEALEMVYQFVYELTINLN